MKFYSLFLFCLVSFWVTGQTHYWAIQYAEYIPSTSTVTKADRGYTIERTRNGDYIERRYDNNRQIREVITYADRRRKTLDGRWTTYYPNGQEATVGHFRTNLRTGKWYEYYEDGELWRYCHYEEDELLSCDTLAWIIADAPASAEALAAFTADALYTPEQVDTPPFWAGCPDTTTQEERITCTDESLYSFAYYELPLPTDYHSEQTTLTVNIIVERDGMVSRVAQQSPSDDRLREWLNLLPPYFPPLLAARLDNRPVRCEYPVRIPLKH
ncbi:MAG: hypothetical protein AAGJ82_04045 [Bacteroidota bacterium]